MIIRVDGRSARDVQAAGRSLGALARGWGHEVDEQAAQVAAGAAVGWEVRGVDPMAVASLILSVPPAALSVLDLADRIKKRRRAAELISHARELAERQVTTSVAVGSRTLELGALTPDQLLDLLADGDSARPGEPESPPSP